MEQFLLGDDRRPLLRHDDRYLAEGIRGFDIRRAYPLMRKNALEMPTTSEEYRDGKGRRGLDSYIKYGYIPLEDPIDDAFHKK